MKAFRINGPGNAGLVEVPRPRIAPHEVVLRVRAAGICGSDVDVLEGARPSTHVRYPVVPGHEFAGEIVETGTAVQRLRVGDRVTAEGVKRCGHCRNCLKGRTSTCLHYDEIGFTSDGAVAEYVAVPERLVHRLPDDVSYEVGALSEPAACAASAVQRAGVQPGDTVVVIGAGTIGLLVLQVARLYSPRYLAAVEVDCRKLEIAREHGATHSFCSTDEDAPAQVLSLSGGAGADVVFECAGSKDSLASTLSYVVKNARIVVLGVVGSGRRLSLDSDYLVCNDIAYQGIAGYSQMTFGWTQRLLASGLIHPEALITHRLNLPEAGQGFQLLKDRRGLVIKVMITA